MFDPLVSRRTILLVGLALLLLALASLGLAHLSLGRLNSVLALLIAGAKAVLIALFFMELKFPQAGHLPRLVGALAVLWLGFLMVGALDDLLTRNWLPAPGK